MSKFLDKNQTVYDIKITAYGKYLIANGKFKPHYYTFLDDNVVYDSNYVGYSEHQNETHNRIKNETEYLEGLVDFESVEKRAGRVTKFVPRDSIVLEPERLTPQKSNFYYEKFIGDAFNSSDKQLAPAMKIVALKGEISSSSGKDLKNNLQVPQLNMEATYTLKSFEPMNLAVNETKYSNLLNTTRQFSDNKIIALEPEDLLIYAEELNTDLLNDNFEIEIFEVQSSALPAEKSEGERKDKLIRRLFEKDFGRIDGGYMTDYDANIMNRIDSQTKARQQINKQSVAEYFNVLVDHEVDRIEACKAASLFNKESYYIDIDFDCEGITGETYLNIDIYGAVTEPEIC